MQTFRDAVITTTCIAACLLCGLLGLTAVQAYREGRLFPARQEPQTIVCPPPVVYAECPAYECICLLED